ncbi:MAG TPA: translation initiation factor IF-3 [Acidimicrobiales bacterium]|nr:translation initiation factor IF-3 [Acidimicrobiales bacterium]
MRWCARVEWPPRAGVASDACPFSRKGTDPRRGCRIATAGANETRINDRIRAREVRLVDADGSQLGIKALPEALQIAREADLDLVEVAPMANPPVCRIMDYGKYKFDAAQRAKESRRKTTNVGIKEMKYRPKIGPGDFETKTRQVSKFLGQGHKVKITIMFRGREMSHQELGLKILHRVAEEVGAAAKIEAAPKVDGRNMIMVLAPDKRAQQAHAPKKAASNGSAPPASGPPAPAPNATAPPAATTPPAPAPPDAVTAPTPAAAPPVTTVAPVPGSGDARQEG